MEIVTARPHRLEGELIRRAGQITAAGGRCMALVPSQETLRTELLLMNGLNLSGSFLIDVLSPGRLRERIFERAGRPSRIPFDERGRRMVLSAVLEEERENLRYFGRTADNGPETLAQKLSEAIACFKRAKVTPEALEKRAAETEDEALSAKLGDLALLYARYEARMEGRLCDAEDLQREVEAKRGPSGVLRGAHVLVSGFDLITPAFAEELCGIDRAAAGLTVLLETDRNGAPDGALFAPVNASLERLRKTAEAQGVPLTVLRADRPLEAHGDLRALEAGLYALGEEPRDGNPEHVRLCAASGIRMEIQLTAARIRRLLAGGVPPEDIAVCYPGGADYAALLSAILPEFGIAGYTAEKRRASAHPFARFILSALAAGEGGSFSMPDAMECVQSGFLPVGREEADALVSYCEQMEIRGNAFGRPFRYKTDARMTDEALARLEDSRARVKATLDRFAAAMKAAEGADGAVRALLSLLEETRAAEKLTEMARQLRDRGMESEAQDCAQLWDALMDTLDQLHELLGGSDPSCGLVRTLLAGGLQALELSALPPAEGAVICGEIGNLRAGSVHTLFVLGQNDREGSRASGLFTEEERTGLEEQGVYLGMSDREREAMARLDLLKLLASAREQVVISYALSDETGSALREGESVRALRRLFPELPVTFKMEEEELEELLCAPEPAAKALALYIREPRAGEENAAFAEACAALAGTRRGEAMLSLLESGLTRPAPRLLGRETAGRLYGRGRQTSSVSRLETFAQCPYRYFAGYGLRPRRERKPGEDAADLGSLQHAAAERFVSSALREADFPELSAETMERLLGEAQEELLAAWRQTPRGETGRGRATERRVRRTASRVARTILDQYRDGQFRPAGTELAFGEGDVPALLIRLADGTHLHLRGKIDRVDVLPGGEPAIRIVDYKSSAKRVEATKVYYGLQLQLILYMAAALERLGGIPAGFFYFRIDDPTIHTDSRVREEVERQIAERLSLSGIALADVRILKAMGGKHARMIRKDGGITARSAGLADEKEMAALLGFAREKAAELQERIDGGEIDVSPYRIAGRSEENACRFCDYAALCGFDPSRQPWRLLENKTLEDLTDGPEAHMEQNCEQI